MIRIYKAKSYDEMSRKAANVIASQIIMKPDCVLGLATGSTPIGTYKELIHKYEEGDLDFSTVKTVNLDEYQGLSADNNQSYAYFMSDNLFNHVNIDKKNTHLPNGKASDIEAECAAYDRLVEEMGGADLQLLGIGNNGHIGFNEPEESFPKNTHSVALTQSTIDANSRLFEKMEDVPKDAITMGIGTIMQAKKILLIANGKAKTAIMKEALFGPITPNVPASILQLHPDVIVIGDEEALAEIEC